ncbi:MAG: hypothetical protein ACE369_14685 [Roseovarius sp.]
MTTLDHFAARPAARFNLQNAALAVTTLILLALGGVALTAPPADVSTDWHGNVAASQPR